MRYFIIILLLFIISCSSNSDDVKNDTKKAPENKPAKINTDYEYEKLDVSKLYSKNNNDILTKIDFSTVKNIKNSLLYSEDGKVYIERSPFEVYELLLKKGNKRTIEDNILFLKISLELSKNDKVDSILDNLKNSNLVLSDIKNTNAILARFNLFDKETSFLTYKLNKLLKVNKKFNKENEERFLYLLNLLDSVKNVNLLKSDNKEYFETYFKIDKFNKVINQRYIDKLISDKKYKEVDSFINGLLSLIKKENINYNKNNLLLSLISVYKKTNQNKKIRSLYLDNTKLPENKALFNEYISYLKKEKTWVKELKYFIVSYNKNKTLDNFYRYYLALKYENKDIKNLLNDYYKNLLKTKNEIAIKEFSLLLINNGRYNNAFELLNIALLGNKKSKYYDDFVILMAKTIEGLPYSEKKYRSYYFFSVPDVIGGILSLIQNQYKDNDFLATLDNQNNIKNRIEDMNFLFEKNKKAFKSTERLVIFSERYFNFLNRYHQGKKILSLIKELRSLNKDIVFNISLLKVSRSYISSGESAVNNEIYKLYLELLSKNKDNKDKFSKYLTETLDFIGQFTVSNGILKVKELIKIYPQNERLYEKLLSLLERYRAYGKKLDVYEEALKRFDKKTWADKYSRFLIRQKWNYKMRALNKKLINLLNKDEYQSYLTSIFSSKKYGKFNTPFNELYADIYVDALNKYPFNKVLINKLLRFYDGFRYSYSYRSQDAINKYAWLLYKYIYIYDDFRDKYFKDKLITKNMKHDKIIETILKKDKKSIPDLKYLAYRLEYKGEFEKAVEYYSILSQYYITNKNIIFKTAKLYKSLASSFYIKDKSFLTKSEKLYKRLSFLYRNESRYYISLAELYYELMQKNNAEKTLFRALEFEKGKEQKYIDIANMFYDYYDYDSALKTIYIYRKRKSDDNLLIPFVGRLFELKNQYKLAVNEYFRDFLSEKSDSYQSEKRLKTLLNKKSLKDLIILNIEGNISNAIRSKELFNKFNTFLISVNNNLLLDKLYTNLYEDGKDITLLKQLYYIFKDKNDNRQEDLLKNIEKLDKTDDTYRMQISFYKGIKNIRYVSDYYEKLLLINPYENDKYSYINILEEYCSYLIKNKEYDGAINNYNTLLTYIKDKNEKLTYKLKISKIYKSESKEKYLKYLLDLDSKYSDSEQVSNDIFAYYKQNNEMNKMVSYLNELIKRTKKENSLSYNEKKYRIANYRELLIQQLVSLKKYSSVLDQYIEILNRNPLDFYMAEKVYNFAKINKIENKLFDYYTKLSKKSFKNHKYLLLNAKFSSLKKDFNKELEYYQKAELLEPQKTSIKYDIANTLVKLKRYKEAYELYNDLYLKEHDSYRQKDILKNMFVISIYLKDVKLIEELAVRIINYPESYSYSKEVNTAYIARTLHKNNYLILARNYYKKLIDPSFNFAQVSLNSNILYQYSQTFINRGEGLKLIKNIVEFNNKLITHSDKKDKYSVSVKKKQLFAVFSRYIPDNISYFSKTEINSMNSYFDSLDSEYDKYLAEYYRKMKMTDKWFSRLTGRYIKNTKMNYYKSILDYNSILNQGLYKSYKYNGAENITFSKYRKAFITYVWKDKKEAFKILKDNIFQCDTYRTNAVAIDSYIEYLRSTNMNEYKKLTIKSCIYSNVLSNYIKYSEKKLALELIDAQDRGDLWSLTEKIKLYWALKEFNKEGVAFYNQILAINSTISEEVKGSKNLLTETHWDNTIKEYSNYMLKAGLIGNLSDYVNNIIEIAPKSVKAYIVIADIYSDNKKYKESVKYLNYAKQLQDKTIINVKLANNYLKLGEMNNFSKIKAKILKSKNINSFYKFFKVLEDNKKLDGYFISVYTDLIIKDYTSYGYYKLKSFIKQVLSYYTDKPISELILFVNNFDTGKYEIYKSLLMDTDKSFNNNYKLKLFNEIIKYHTLHNTLYSKRTWVLAKAEFLSKINKNSEAIELLSKNKSIFTYENESLYTFNIFKLYYKSKNILKANELFRKSLLINNYEEYSLQKYFDFVINSKDKKFNKNFLLSFLDELKVSDMISMSSLLKVMEFLDDNKLKSEILYLINNKNLSRERLYALESLVSKRKLEKLYSFIVDIQYNKYYSNFNYTKMNEQQDYYYLYIINLIKLDKKVNLKIVLDNRKLSLKQIDLIASEIKNYSDYQNEMMIKNLTIENQDVFYIKALLNYNLKKYTAALTEINKINVDMDYKYNFRIPALKVKILSKLNQLNDIGVLEKSIKAFPLNKELKYKLFEYYLKNNDNEKAMFVLGEIGLNFYLVFNGFTGYNFKYLSLYSYNDYSEGDYSSYYEPENIASKVFSNKKDTEFTYIENFISQYSLKEKKMIVKFLYEHYKKAPKNKKLGLHILYSYSKLDKSYKKEYEDLLKEK